MSSVGILGSFWRLVVEQPLPALGALRSAAQLVSYEVALSFALLSGLMVAERSPCRGSVKAQQERQIWFIVRNYGFMIVPFVVYIIAATAETNRAPVRSAGSRIGAGGRIPHRVQRLPLGALLPGGIREHLRGVVGGGDALWGGWLRPFPNVAWLEIPGQHAVSASCCSSAPAPAASCCSRS
jgi:NADH-quinone oxidoreductase subunit H